MATETKASFPSIPIGHFLTLRGQFKKSIPSSISTNYLASILDMTEGAASTNIMPGLKLLKLIDNDNKVNSERVKKFRDDEQYRTFCQEVLKDCYPKELLEAFPELPDDRSKIKRWFMNHTGVGDNAAGKFASMFGILLEANPSKTSEGKTSSPGVKPKAKDPKPKALQQKSAAPVHSETPHTPHHQTPPSVTHNPAPEVHINVQVHIASDATNEQIEKIFESMGKHLFNRNK